MESGFVYKNVLNWVEVPIVESEVFRYLGYSGKIGLEQAQQDERVSRIVKDAVNEMHHALSPQAVYAEYPIQLLGDDQIDLGFTQTQSHNLYTNLQGCDRIMLFAATIGPKADILIQKNSRLDPLKGVIMQAAGAMFIESFCDTMNDRWNKEYAESGYKARPRFSPGYGDFLLDTQKSIFHALSCSTKIGLTLMDTMIMAPGKSVTAVIGYQKTDCMQEHGIHDTQCEIQQHTHHQCSQCTLTQCEFREEGTL